MLTGANLKYANSYNIRLILEMIRLKGPLSRIDISRSTQLSAQTVTNITKKLLKTGLIYESSRHQEGRGAPSIMLKISPDAGYSIGIDFDKDHLTCLLVDLDGNIKQQCSLNLDHPTPEEAMDLIARKVEKIIGDSGVDREKIWGVGVGFPGPMAVLEESVRLNAVNPQFLPGWNHVPVVKILEEKLKIPVYLENNASAAALGERWYGGGREIGTFFYIFFGAGLGGGLVLNGQLYPGYTGNAGEIGYLPVFSNDAPAHQGTDRPHLGMYFNLSSLYRKLNENGFSASSPLDLQELFNDGNDIITEWAEIGSRQLAVSIVGIEYLIDPETIFLGGRLPQPILKFILKELKQALSLYRFPDLKKAPVFRITGAGQHAAALGAATLPMYASFAPIPNLMLKNSRNNNQVVSPGNAGLFGFD